MAPIANKSAVLCGFPNREPVRMNGHLMALGVRLKVRARSTELRILSSERSVCILAVPRGFDLQSLPADQLSA